MTVIGDSYQRFDNLSGSHYQNQVKSFFVSCFLYLTSYLLFEGFAKARLKRFEPGTLNHLFLPM